MRYFALTPFVLALGIGGAALAEPAGVADPWGRSPGEADTWFAHEAAETRPAHHPEIRDPWTSPEASPDTARTPTAVASPATARADAPARQPSTPVPPVSSGLGPGEARLLDPWASTVASDMPSLRSTPSAAQRAVAAWSEPFVEVADPWNREPGRVTSARVRLSVDPWAR